MKFVILLFFSVSTYSLSTYAEPLYELGLAVGGGFVPDYPGADQGRARTIIVPSFIYRGEILKNDRRGSRALFFTSKKWDLDFSFGAAFPIDAEDNRARNGMDDLDWLFEVGPRLTYFFYRNKKRILSLEFPLRFITSTDGEFTRERGTRFLPQLDYRENLTENWRFGASYKLNYGNETINDYIYEVPERSVTEKREFYDAKAGFISQDLAASFFYRNETFIGVVGVSHRQFHNATNEDSPLLRVKNNTAVFLAFNYFFFQSRQQGKIDQSGEY